MWNEEVPGPLEYTPVLATRYAPDPLHVKRGGALLLQGRAAGDLCRPGRALGARLAAAQGARRAAGAPVITSLGGKSAFPENHPLVARLRRRRHAASTRAALPRRSRRDLRHRLQLHRDQLRDRHAEGQDDHPRDARSRPSQQGHARASLGLVGDAGSDARGVAARARRNRCRSRATQPRSRARSPRCARSGSANGCAKLTSNAAPLSPYRVIWDLLHTVDVAEHDHHARRRQPARPALAVLADDRRRSPTSAGARRRSWATGSAWRWGPSSRSRTSSASMSGATRRSASPAWISRPRCASASRSCRSCSTTSRWRSS